MFFFLKYNYNGSPVRIQEGKAFAAESNVLYVEKGLQSIETLELASGMLYLLGDPVFATNWKNFIKTDIDESVLYEQVKGHYYWFFLSKTRMQCGTSFGSIFPIYYYEAAGEVSASSSSVYLAERLNNTTPNKRNLLERLLFNYSFFNSTWWEEIHLLAAHRHLDLSSTGLQIAGTFEVSDYFGQAEDHSRKSLTTLADLFQTETQLFFPDTPFAISLTGGFDGRTLVATAKKANCNFLTYSFGIPTASDVKMPQAQAAQLNIPYLPIYLNQHYLENNALEAAQSFMQLTEYNGNFGRPHYAFAAQKLSEQVSYILTGNFGSELFRALHLPGVMMTEGLIRLFSAQDESWKDFLRAETQNWVSSDFSEELETLIADLEAYLAKMQGWESNHKFYYFVWNEIFRKYFGPELVMQSHFLNNRTPYLNLTFFKAINKTGWAGVHSRLFEKDKSRRMKGQLFYATLLQQADKKFYKLSTSKGYSPADVLENWRLPLLAAKVAGQKFLKPMETDENAVNAFFQLYHPEIAARLQDNPAPFFEAKLDNSLQDIPEEKRLAHWIKFYSIANGWAEATKSTVSLKV